MMKKLAEEEAKAGALARGLVGNAAFVDDDAADDEDAESLENRNFLKKKKGAGDEAGGEDAGDGEGAGPEDEEDGDSDAADLASRNFLKKKRKEDDGGATAEEDDEEDPDLQAMAMADDELAELEYDPDDEEKGDVHNQLTDDFESRRKAMRAKHSAGEDGVDGDDALNIDRQNSNTYKAGEGATVKQFPLDHFGNADGTWEQAGIDDRKGPDGPKIYVFITPEVKMRRIPDCTRLPVYWISRERPGRSTKLQAWLFKEYEPERVARFDDLPLQAQKLLLSYSSVENKDKKAEIEARLKKAIEEQLLARQRQKQERAEERAQAAEKNIRENEKRAEERAEGRDETVEELKRQAEENAEAHATRDERDEAEKRDRKSRIEEDLLEAARKAKQRGEESAGGFFNDESDDEDLENALGGAPGERGDKSKSAAPDESGDQDQSAASDESGDQDQSAASDESGDQDRSAASDESDADGGGAPDDADGSAAPSTSAAKKAIADGPVKDRQRQRELGFILSMAEMVMNPDVSIEEGLASFCLMLSDAFAKATVTLFLQTGIGRVTPIATQAGVLGAAPWAMWQEIESKGLPLLDAAAKEGTVKMDGDAEMVKIFCAMIPQAPGVPLAHIVITNSRLSADKSNYDIAYLRAVSLAGRGFLLAAMRKFEELKAKALAGESVQAAVPPARAA